VRTTPQQFLATLRNLPARQPRRRFVEAAKNDPAWVTHLEAIEHGFEKAYTLGDDDPIWLARFDELRAIVGRYLTVKERLLAIGRAFEAWQVSPAANQTH